MLQVLTETNVILKVSNGTQTVLNQALTSIGTVFHTFAVSVAGNYSISLTVNNLNAPAPFYIDNMYIYEAPTPTNDFVTMFTPDVVAYNDYYPFGMLIKERSFSGTEYRYGYNSMEKDDELKGEGNSYNFGARMLDSRIGRWLKTDALESQFPYDSPYIASGNSPISHNDPDGNRKRKVTLIYNEKGEYVGQTITHVDYSFVKEKVYKRDILVLGGTELYNDQVIEYDYYDSIDLEIAIQGVNGKILYSNIVEQNILADKRIEGAHPATAGIRSNALAMSDWLDDQQENDDNWGGGGIDFYSKNGEGSGVRATDRTKLDYINGDDLISILSIGKSTGKTGAINTTPHPEILKRDSQIIKILEKVKKGVSDGKKIVKYKEKLVDPLVRKICNQCNVLLEKYEEDSHPTLGEGTRDTISD